MAQDPADVALQQNVKENGDCLEAPFNPWDDDEDPNMQVLDGAQLVKIFDDEAQGGNEHLTSFANDRIVSPGSADLKVLCVELLPIFVKPGDLKVLSVELLSSFVKEYPQPCDILKGRHPDQPGNNYLARSVDSRYDEYNASSKSKKTHLAKDMVETFYKQGRRFLEERVKGKDQRESLWKKMTDKDAHEKVTTAFRSITKARKRKREQQ